MKLHPHMLSSLLRVYLANLGADENDVCFSHFGVYSTLFSAAARVGEGKY